MKRSIIHFITFYFLFFLHVSGQTLTPKTYPYFDKSISSNSDIAAKAGKYASLKQAETLALTGGGDITSCGQTTQLNATLTPADTSSIIGWSVDNKDVAYVSDQGKVYPRQNGTVNVTATATFNDGTSISGSKGINISNQSIGDYSLFVMGSSTAAGTGASPGKGYAYLLANWLSNDAEHKWTTINKSNGGDNTVTVINRWDSDLLPACSRYVYYCLTLGNEGIHDLGQSAFNSFRDNMQYLISLARSVGKVPLMGNNFIRDDFNATDYNYVKQMNLLIHEWDLPSVNLLGAVDDGSGHWAAGYGYDALHPNDAGHAEMFYAIVPSLFDALADGKPLPVRVNNTSLTLKKDDEKRIAWSPENIMHSFTLSFSFKTTSTGTLASFTNDNQSSGFLKINSDGKLVYETQSGALTSPVDLNDGQWHQVSLTHYYARGRTFLYVDSTQVTGTDIAEKLVPIHFYLGDFNNALASVDFKELFLHRSGMNDLEIPALHRGEMLKSSLEIYSPLDGTASSAQKAVENLAQSLNTLKIEQKGNNTNLENLDYPYKNASILISAVNGAINAKATNGSPVRLKIYTTSGQKIADGLNRVQLSNKGIYIVKATAGDIIQVSKVVYP